MNKTAAVVIALVLGFSVSALAGKEHRHHKAHKHGVAELSIAFEKTKGSIEFKVPAFDIIGFEKVAKTEKDIQQKQAAIEKWKSSFNQMVILPKDKNCTVTEKKIDQEHHGKHSDFVAIYDVTCNSPLVGSSIELNFADFFATLKEVNVTALVDEVQKSLVVKS